MSLVQRALHRSADLCFVPPLDKLWRQRLLGKVICLLYHRVDEPGRAPFLERFGTPPIPPDQLHDELQFLKSRGARFMTFSDLRQNRFPQADQFGVIVSFDDGLRDNYTNGFPVLDALGIKGVLFQATALVGASSLIWEHALYWYWQDEALRRQLTAIAHRAQPHLQAFADRQLLVSLRETCTANAVEAMLGEMAALDGCAGALHEAARRFYPAAADVLAAHASGHELGSHGHRHYPRKNIDGALFVQELETSIRVLQQITGETPAAFSYPFNSHLPGDTELASPLFEQLVTVDGGLIERSTPQRRLPRYTWPGPHRSALRRRRWLWTGGA